MDHILAKTNVELIYPEEVKVEYQKIDDLSELIDEMKFLEDTFLSAEVKLGTIKDRWQTYFEDDILCNFNLMQDWLLSIKSCLDEITQKFAPAPAADEEYLPDSLEIKPIRGDDTKEEDQDNHNNDDKLRRRKTRRPTRNVSPYPDQESSSPRSISSVHHEDDDTNWTPYPEDLESPETRSKKRGTIAPKNPKFPKIPKASLPQREPPSTSHRPPRGKYRPKGAPPLPTTSECHICHKIVSYRGLRNHIQRVHEPHLLKFPCPTCPSRFRSNAELTTHSRIHSDTKQFTCSVCGWAFHRAPNLAAHMKTHSDDRPLKCDQCDATFKYVQSLKMHVDAVHSAKKRNQCSECGKLFLTITKLRRHEEQVHQSLRRYECPRCDKVFKRAQHLRYHEKTHDNPNTKNRGLNKSKS